MKGFKRCVFVLKHTGAIRIFCFFVFAACVAALVLCLAEPEIETYGDGLWYCFVASTTVGFGDFYAVTAVGRIITIFITLFGIMTVAMVPGVVVAYYTEYLKTQEEETISEFMEKLENLPNLSREELETLSGRVKEFRRKTK